MVKGNKGANRLARVMMMAADRRIKKKVFHAVLGTVRSDMSLLLDDSPEPIPAGDYLVASLMRLPEVWQTEEELGHRHDFKWPDELKPLKPGDRVIVLPVNGGSDYVVIGRVV